MMDASLSLTLAASPALLGLVCFDEVEVSFAGMHAPTAVATPYHRYTWLSAEPCLAAKQLSASVTAFKKNIADMADLLKQMWFLLLIEMCKLWHKGTTSR